MSKRLIRITALAMVLMFCLSVPAAAAASVPDPATPQSDAYIGSFVATIGSLSKGTLTVNFQTTGTGAMSTIGATKIIVYKWNSPYPVATLSSGTTPSMLAHNTVTHGGSYSFSGTSGEQYYAVVYCYAARNGGNSTQKYVTGYATCR